MAKVVITVTLEDTHHKQRKGPEHASMAEPDDRTDREPAGMRAVWVLLSARNMRDGTDDVRHHAHVAMPGVVV